MKRFLGIFLLFLYGSAYADSTDNALNGNNSIYMNQSATEVSTQPISTSPKPVFIEQKPHNFIQKEQIPQYTKTEKNDIKSNSDIKNSKITSENKPAGHVYPKGEKNSSILSTKKLINAEKKEYSAENKHQSNYFRNEVNTGFILNSKVYDLLSNRNSELRPSGIIYQENQTKISAINPNSSVSSYPGQRGPNQLIIYTPAYGYRTGTNEFGTEAIVENNMVTSLNGADSIIPRNGFVISGHGNAKKWILKNIQLGTKVYIDSNDNTLRVFLTPESLLFAAKEKLKEVSGLVEYYRQMDILYNDKKASEYLNTSKDYLRKAEKKPDKTQTYINNAMTALDSAIKNAIPYMKDEMKGVWLRPTESNEDEIKKTIERLSDAGISDIFLETYFHGKTIYPSSYLKDCGVISQREEFVGFDPLDIWIKEAHKKNIKVHIWFETFYVGNDKPSSNPNHVLSVHPDWSNKRLYNYDATEPTPSLSEHNGYFLDPSNNSVQTYLIGILNEIITKYQPDGINLDYIRYPQTVEPSYSNYASMNWGYTKTARENFASLYGIDPIEIKYGTAEWDNWSAYRQNKITEFIVKVHKLTQNNNIMLTTVIFPDLKKCIATKMQNWKQWSANNYIDGFTPLILTGDKNTADLLLNDIIRNTSQYTNIYPGLFVTFMGGSTDDLLLQIHKTREYRTKGSIIFDYAHLKDNYIEALTTRAFNKNYEPRDSKLKQNQRPTYKRPPKDVIEEKQPKKRTKNKVKRKKSNAKN